MGILFILDGQANAESINTFLNLCEAKREELLGEAGSSKDDRPKGIFRIITSKDHFTDVKAGGIQTAPPITEEFLANNPFAGMSMDDLESWMLFRVKIGNVREVGDPVEFGRASTWYWALDAKDIKDRTCSAMHIREKENPGGAMLWERPVLKVRVPWEEVYKVEMNLSLQTILLEQFTEESLTEDFAMPSDGWCKYLD